MKAAAEARLYDPHVHTAEAAAAPVHVSSSGRLR